MNIMATIDSGTGATELFAKGLIDKTEALRVLFEYATKEELDAIPPHAENWHYLLKDRATWDWAGVIFQPGFNGPADTPEWRQRCVDRAVFLKQYYGIKSND